MSACNHFYNFFKEYKKKYDKVYIVVDVHNTILKPSFDKEETFEYFPYAKEVLRLFSQHPNIVLIMWTGCYPDKLKMYKEHFESEGINFKYVNENPECQNSSYACLDQKFYFDIGFDDRFGFNPIIEWKAIYEAIKYHVEGFMGIS